MTILDALEATGAGELDGLTLLSRSEPPTTDPAGIAAGLAAIRLRQMADALEHAGAALTPGQVVAWVRRDGRHRYRCRALPARLRTGQEHRRGLALVHRCDRAPGPLAPPLARLARSLDRHAPPALGPREVCPRVT